LNATNLLDHKKNQENGIGNAQQNVVIGHVDDIRVQVQHKVAKQQQLQQHYTYK